jgi:hypothetical protein
MSNISRASVPSGQRARYLAMSSSVHGTQPPLSREAFALPLLSPIVGSSSGSMCSSSIIQPSMWRWNAGYAHTRSVLERQPWIGEFDPLSGAVLHEHMEEMPMAAE